jgi:hypothetical protein
VREHKLIARPWLYGLLLMSACGTGMEATEDETFEVQGDEIIFRGTGRTTFLSESERKAYASDRQYLRGLMPRGTAVGLNHADPRQRRFALLRTKLAGKTRANSPQLFKLMDELKTAHEAQGLVAGAVLVAPASDGTRESQHEVMTAGISPEDQMVQSGAMASRMGSLSYGFVDSSAWDEFGNLLGDTNYAEVFGNMRHSLIQSTGDLAFAEGENVEGDSFLAEVIAGTNRLYQSYIIAESQPITAANMLNVPIVAHPTDFDGNQFAVVCLDRVWTQDCEYNNTGFGTLKVPLKGSVSVTGAGMAIDRAAIVDYQSDDGPAPGRIAVTLGTSGGGCVLPAGGAVMSMKDFWRQVSVSPDNLTTMSWDLHSVLSQWASFSPSCRLVQDTVYLRMDLAVPWVNELIGAGGDLNVHITNEPPERPLEAPNLYYPTPLRITNSCLAEGTLIGVGGSVERAIENLEIGDRVLSPYADRLTVIDTASGTERSLMVRIADARGRELLMTETHPLYVIGRGMVAAKHVRVGDRVKTDDGPSELIRVNREPYTGKVFNLKVGTPAETRALGVDETAVFANGFLVGDGQIQDRHEVLELHAERGAQSTRLPASWRQDYNSSRNRAARAMH